MIADAQTSIIEEVRSAKEANAAKHDFDVARIIASARQRQEASGRRIIRQGEQDGADQPATAPESESEDRERPNSESEVRPR
jgi:hypothetical protein